MQELHEDKRGQKSVSTGPVTRRTAILVVVLFAVVILGALTLLTTKTGQQISGLQLNSLASLAFEKTGRSVVDQASTKPVVNCLVAPCPGDPNEPLPPTNKAGVSSPATGDAWKVGETQKIRWDFGPQLESKFVANTVTIALQQSPSCLDLVPACAMRSIAPYTIATNEANDGEFDWAIPASLADQYITESKIVVTLNNVNNQVESGRFTLVKSTIPNPGLVITSPAGSGSWTAGKTYPIQWSGGGFPQLKVTISISVSSSSSDNAPLVIASKQLNNGSYQWTIPSTLPAEYYANPVIIEILVSDGKRAQSQPFRILNNVIVPAHPDGTLIKNIPGENNPTGVYLIEQGKRRPIGSGDIFNCLGYNWNNIVSANSGDALLPVGRALTCTPAVRHPDGSLVLGLFNTPSSVCLIENGKLRPFPTGEVFVSHGYHWDKIVPANSGDAVLPVGEGMTYPSGTLVRNGQALRAYYLVHPNNVLRAFSTYDIFQGMGYRAGQSYIANPDQFTIGSAMTAFDSHPPGTDIVDNGVVYRIGADKKRHGYPSISVYDTWHTYNADFTRVVPANGFDRLLLMGIDMQAR